LTLFYSSVFFRFIYKFVIFPYFWLPEETLGQADTVYQGIKHIKEDKEIYIFNKKFINNDKNKKRYIMYRIYKYYFLVR